MKTANRLLAFGTVELKALGTWAIVSLSRMFRSASSARRWLSATSATSRDPGNPHPVPIRRAATRRPPRPRLQGRSGLFGFESNRIPELLKLLGRVQGRWRSQSWWRGLSWVIGVRRPRGHDALSGAPLPELLT